MFLWYFAPLIITLMISCALCYFFVGPLALPKGWKILLELLVVFVFFLAVVVGFFAAALVISSFRYGAAF